MKLLTLALLAIFSISASAADHQVSGKIAAVGEEYGNIDTDLTPAALAELGIKAGDSFTVTGGGHTFSVYLGETYSDVPRGDWVAFITAGGNLRIARNLESAAAALGAKAGDTLTLGK